MPQFWCLLLTGVAGGVFLGMGEFAAAAVLAAWAVWQAHRGSHAQRGLLLCFVEFCLLAGLVFYYRDSVRLQCLALFALLGAFIEAHARLWARPPVKEAVTVVDRLRLLAIACWFATVTQWFVEGSDPLLGRPLALPVVLCLVVCSAFAHFNSIVLIARTLVIGRRRRRGTTRLTLVKPRLVVAN